MITTQLALLIDVFPHEGETSNDYHRSNIIQSSSRTGAIASSHVQITENASNDKSYTVREDIHLKYNCYEIRFPDTITVRDDEEGQEQPSNEQSVQNEENITEVPSNETSENSVNPEHNLARLTLFSNNENR